MLPPLEADASPVCAFSFTADMTAPEDADRDTCLQFPDNVIIAPLDACAITPPDMMLPKVIAAPLDAWVVTFFCLYKYGSFTDMEAPDEALKLLTPGAFTVMFTVYAQ